MSKKWLSFLFTNILLLTLLLGVVEAQEQEKRNLILAWDQLATRADEVIEKSEASNEALKMILSDLLTQRKEVYAEQLSSSEKISQYLEELEALGPPPGEGEFESSSISERRESLNVLVDATNVPFLGANAMLKRTDFLISEINGILRDRLTSKLFSFGASPADFTFWLPAARSISDFFSRMKRETTEIVSSKTQRTLFFQKLPLMALLLGLSFIAFLFYRRGIVFTVVTHFGEKNSTRITPTFQTCISGVSYTFLLASIFFLTNTLKFSGLLGFNGLGFLSALETMAIISVTGLWMSDSLLVLSPTSVLSSLLHPGKIRVSSRLVFFLGLILSLNVLIQQLGVLGSWSLEIQAVLNFPIIVMAGLLLYNLSSLFNSSPDLSRSSEEEESYKTYFPILNLTKNVIRLISFLAPILALSGYFFAAQKLLYPSLFSLGVLFLSFIIFIILNSALEGSLLKVEGSGDLDDRNRVTIFPILLALFIIFLNIPIVGLIWGAQFSDLYAVWVRLNDGIPLGSARLTLPDLISLLVVFGIGYAFTRLFQRILKTSVLPKMSFDTGGQNAIISGVGYTGIILSTMVAVSSTGLNLSSLAIVAGALSVGLGFGLQTIVSNFVSGIILLIERPIKEGDWIEVAGFSGTVRKISVRSTQIQTFDRGTVIVPNSELISGSVLNYTHSNSMGRVRVPIGVAYGTDPRKVEEILINLAKKHPQVMREPAPSVVFMGFGPDSLDFEIRAFMKDVGYVLAIKSDLNYEIVRVFKKEGIEIPFAQRDVTITNIKDLRNLN